MRLLKHKKHIMWSTGNWVVMYTILYAFLMILYSLPRMAISLAGNVYGSYVADILKPGCFDSIGTVLNIFGWGLLAITAGYAGIDRATMAVKTSFMEMGSADMGSPKKVRKVIYLLFGVFVIAIICNYFHSDFIYKVPVFNELESGDLEVIDFMDVSYPGIEIPLTETASALVSTIVMYVLGNKSVRLTQNIDITKETQDWANEKEERTSVNSDNIEGSETTNP